VKVQAERKRCKTVRGKKEKSPGWLLYEFYEIIREKKNRKETNRVLQKS
jgi:hypothetical protein